MLETKNISKSFFNKNKIVIYFVIVLAIVFMFIIGIYNKDSKHMDILYYIKNYFAKVKVVNLSLNKKAIVYENLDSDVVHINLIFKGGAALDTPPYYGISSLLSKAILHGAGGLNADELNLLLEKYSIKINATAHRDHISIDITMLNYYFVESMNVLSMIINNPNLDNQALLMAKNELFTSININQSTSSFRLNKALREALFPNSVHYQDITGTKDSINQINGKLLVDFKNKIFTQNNLYIAVSGNVSNINLQGSLNNIILNLKQSSDPNNFNLPKITPKISNQVIKVYNLENKQTEIFLVYQAPKQDTLDFIYANILNAYLGVIPDSLLFDNIRNKQGLVYTIRSSLYKDLMSSFLIIYLGTAEETNQIAIGKIKEILQSLMNKDYNFKDILIAKHWYLANTLNIFADNASTAYYFNQLQLNNVTVNDDLNKYIMINNISKNNINNLINNMNFNDALILKTIKDKK